MRLLIADDDVIIACGNNTQFRRLCEVLGIPEVAEDERFADVGDRTDRREELRPILEAELAERTGPDGLTALDLARSMGAVDTAACLEARAGDGAAA